MLKINQDLQNKLIQANKEFKQNYITNIVNTEIKEQIEKNINKINKINNLTPSEIKKILPDNNSIVGVDGSINTVGLIFPHYISLMQALAKSTCKIFDSITICDIHTPLIDKSYLNDNPKKLPFEVVDEKIRSNKLALLELEVAYQSIDKLNPKIILMDGSLTRYYNASKSKWKQFIKKIIEKDIYLIGIIEEIRTNELNSRLNIPSICNMYDKDILFGLLEQNEMFILNDWDIDGINKCFIRTSKDPNVIGIDFMQHNIKKLEEILSIILSLTPDDSRGIPLWLDIIDNEVKLSDKMTQALVENYIEKDIIEKLLKPKRQNRKL